MLHDFLVTRRQEILDRSRTLLATRVVPTATASELASGLPLFLDQLILVLGQGKAEREAGHHDVGESAARRGGALQRMGLTVGQVVHDYGSVCQSVTQLADEMDIAITASEFQTFNRCLDDAIAKAVTAHEQQREGQVNRAATEELGSTVHEMRNMLTTSMLSYDALKRGTIGIHGSTGFLLGNSLKRMRVLLDRTIAEVRLGAAQQVRERVQIAELMEEIEIVAAMEATDHAVRLSIDNLPPDVAVDGDRHMLTSALANLVQNALKFTRPRGQVTVRAYVSAQRVFIDVEDQCGGLPPGQAEELFRPFEQRGADRTGLGLGLSISLRAVRANGGELRVRDLPGVGCVFTIDLPRASPPLATP